MKSSPIFWNDPESSRNLKDIMYIRTTKRKNKDGSVVEYYQLAYNKRDPITKNPVAHVIHSFGRADQIDRDSLVRLCKSIARICDLEVHDIFDSNPASNNDIEK